ncbi:ATP-binding protein [Streptomyces sp. NPDC052020]|uniref:ATP-binding protein n=1 Tax=Streptomyces sp. NPDC052020 TaxID=3155677 RepID=UPI00342A49E2
MEPRDGAAAAATGDAPVTTPVRGAVDSAASARAYARSVVRAEWDEAGREAREQDVIDLLLVVSELVTNAIRHGGGLAGFEAWATSGGIRVAVHDYSEVIPEAALGAAPLPVTHRGSGYGWPLIVRLAREVAVDRRTEGGKTISALVPIRPAEPA